MQRAAPLGMNNFGFRSLGLFERLVSGHGDKSIQPGIELFDPLETLTNELDWRELAMA
jgi:hypothetical protein